MKKSITSLVAGAVLLAPMSVASPADAALPTKAKKYKTCKVLNKKYKHGVGLKGKKNKIVSRSGKKITYRVSRHKVSKSLYRANKRLDRDKDGIACER